MEIVGQRGSMKIALVGTGRTGSSVASLLKPEELVGPFNRGHRPTADALMKSDAVILFVPGDAVNELIEPVMQSGRPSVWASTGMSWPQDLHHQLVAKNLCWVASSNFSLLMALIRQMIGVLSTAKQLVDNPIFHLHEIHHAGKKDGPSGTALLWKEWLGLDIPITFSREGDIKGIHQLTLSTPTEKLALQHDVLDRSVFASGALWVAEKLAQKKFTKPGLNSLQQVVESQLQEKTP